jgi:subfamily B ATP-binding cassette protein MsbA
MLRDRGKHDSLWRRLARLLSFAAPYRVRIGASLLVILVGAILSLVFPLGIQALLDTALQKRDAGLLHLLGVGLLLLFVFRGAVVYFGGYVLGLVGERIVLDLRTRLYGHLHSLDFLTFTNQRIGDLTSRLTSDAASIRNAVTETMVGAALQLFQLAGSVAIMLWLNWRLGFLVVLVAPAASVISRAYGPRLRENAKKVQEGQGRAVAVAQEGLSAVHVVRAFDRAPYEVGRFQEAARALYEAVRGATHTSSFFRALINVVTAMASIIMFWVGGIEVLSGRLTAGELVAFLFYSQGIGQGVAQLAGVYAELSAAAGASDRVFEILDMSPKIVDAPGAAAPAAIEGAIEFQDVGFTYDSGSPVLKGLTFAVAPGETVALVGLSGGGKTTILHLLARFFDPTAGRILLDGRDLRSLSVPWLRRQIALVSQDVFLFGTTVKENIRYGRLEATDAEVESAARAANAHEFILDLPRGYDTEVGERGAKLSGGQRQRIALARAFLKNSKILVLDEATSAVDSASEGRIHEAMESLRRGRTIVVVAHRLGTVMRADRLLVVQDGRVVQAGSHETLRAVPGVYRTLLENQLEPAARGADEARQAVET